MWKDMKLAMWELAAPYLARWADNLVRKLLGEKK